LSRMTPSPKNSLPEGEDTGEFAVFTTLDALAAYVHHKYGEDCLRQLFAPDPDPEPNHAGIGPREHLENAAEQLDKRGLGHVAAILHDLAQDAISGIDLPPDHYVNCGERGIENWRSKWIQRRKLESGELERELRRDHARKLRQSKTNGQKPLSHRH